jgi:bifunctional UDP-N-acetylglucosamine pyrophosphorylase/glucosamine-1-phosphate N-acetyltransferase
VCARFTPLHSRFSTVILAAGQGKRMYSQTPKILHTILGKPLIAFVVDLAQNINSGEIICVVSPHARDVRRALGQTVRYVVQPIPRGTGDAALRGITQARHKNVLILYGDVPLLQPTTIRHLMIHHDTHNAALTFLTCTVSHPFGYGRIVRYKKKVRGIVEQGDATPEQQKINEINTGIYYGRRSMMVDALHSLTTDNTQKELYLTDIVQVLLKRQKKVAGLMINREDEVMGINSKAELARARQIVKREWFARLMQQGVYIEDPDTTTIDLSVRIGKNVRIRPNTIIEGNTTIASDSVIGPFAWIQNGKKRTT